MFFFSSLSIILVIHCNFCLYLKLRNIIFYHVHILGNSSFSVLINVFIILLLNSRKAFREWSFIHETRRSIETNIIKFWFICWIIFQRRMFNFLKDWWPLGFFFHWVFQVFMSELFYFFLSLIALPNEVRHIHSYSLDINNIWILIYCSWFFKLYYSSMVHARLKSFCRQVLNIL